MSWPLSQDYNEAIQNPTLAFTDPELKRSAAVTNTLGLPIPCSGSFADVYAMQDGSRKWAVKCFTRQIPGLQERYVQISQYLPQVKLSVMVDFRFLEKGIQVRGQWFPILKMQWVEGVALNTFVRDNLDKPQTLLTLAQFWGKLANRLRQANLAHGDLQHGNVMLVPAGSGLGLKLVDYDGMCVPALELLKSIEVGHAAYQHPQRLREGTYGLEIDRFSHLVIGTALRSLAVGGRALWEKFDTGDNLLFTQKDLADPAQAAVFQEVAKLRDPAVQKLVQALSQAAQKPIAQVPLLSDLVAVEAPARPAERAAPATVTAPPATIPLFVQTLRQLQLLEATQLFETDRELAPRLRDVKDLARELLQRGWLTTYQINRLLRGAGQELVLGQCAVLEPAGDVGAVTRFKARHRTAGLCCVLAVRGGRITDSEMANGFLREARAAGAVTHPGLVRILDADLLNGLYYLAVENAEGPTLAKLTADQGALPVAQACAYLQQAAAALQAAHERGVVHRDIKPHKLLVPPDGGPIRVLDLGTALLVGCARKLSPSAEGFLVGSPPYLAPEQAINPLRADGRSDIYSLGCTFFHLLTGWPPFMGVTTMEVLRSHRKEEPPALREVVPDAPPALDAVFRRMMAKRPEERFQTAGELAAALGPFVPPPRSGGSLRKRS